MEFINDTILISEGMMSKKDIRTSNLNFDGGECEVEMAFADGIAVGIGTSLRPLVMTYPKIEELTDQQRAHTIRYTGRDDIIPFDVALAYGKAKWGNLTIQEYATFLVHFMKDECTNNTNTKALIRAHCGILKDTLKRAVMRGDEDIIGNIMEQVNSHI